MFLGQKERKKTMAIKITLLLLFFAVTVFIGLYYRRRSSDVNSFVLGGRSIGPWLTAFAYGTSYFSAVVFVGYAGQFGWKFGTAAVWIGLGNAFIGSLLPWVILGRRTRTMTNHIKSATMPEFFGKRFDSNALKLAAAVIIFIFLIPYTASLYNGLSRLFSMAFGINFLWCIIAMAVLTGIYVVAGGVLGTAVNSVIQGVIMLVGIVAVIAFVLKDNGGFMNAIDSLARVEDAAVSTTPGIFASFLGPKPIDLLGVVLLTSLGAWGLPQMVAKFYSIKSEKAINKGATISTIFALVIAGGCYFLGSFGRIYADRLGDPAVKGFFDTIMPDIVSTMPALLVGIVVLLVLSASISTLAALVMASSSTLTLDFLKGHFVKKMNDKQQLLIIRLLIVVFIAISSIIAILQYTKGISFIADLMGISWGALAGAFLAPFLFGLWWKRATKISVWCSFLFSVAVMTLNIFFRGSFPSVIQHPVNCGAFTMLAGLAIVPLVSAFTKPPRKEVVEDCFSALDAPTK